jgi:hypothetical protein
MADCCVLGWSFCFIGRAAIKDFDKHFENKANATYQLL